MDEFGPMMLGGREREMHSTLLSVAALLASVVLLVFGTNLQGVLLPIRLQLDGASMARVGLLSSGWSAGFMLACLSVGRLVTAVGHVRTFAALAALSGSTALLLLPLQQPPAWIALRVVIGFCYGGLALIIESWLNERATQAKRGGIFAAYMTANLVASLAGTLSLTVLDPRGPMPFVLMVAAVVMSIVPVALTRSPVPKPTRPFSIHLGELFAVSPSGVSGCFAAGLVSGAVGGLGPTFGLAMGLSTHGVAVMLACSVLGGALSYYPAGRLSDRTDRRYLVLALSALAIATCALLVLRGASLPPAWLMLVLGVFGFAQYPLYGLCVAFVNDRIRERSFAETASELLLTFSAGTVLGPVAGAAVMAYGAANLFVFVGAVLALESAFIVWRLVHVPSPVVRAAERCDSFEATPGSMSVLKSRRNAGLR